MPSYPEYDFQSEDGHGVLTLSGDWTVHTLGPVQPELAELQVSGLTSIVADLEQVGRIDTAGAFLLDRLACRAGVDALETRNSNAQADSLLDQARALRPEAMPEKMPVESHGVVDLFER
ncbi:MAG: ABC transporter permease, partial [Henriciella sp.]